MNFVWMLVDLLRHLGDDSKWQAVINAVGTTNLYVVLFAIIFAETGLVVTPFLPGDSLLFSVGAIGARNVGINVPLISVLLIVAAVLGDAVNYYIGYKLGPAVFNRKIGPDGTVSPATGEIDYATGERRKVRLMDRLLNRKHLERAQEFYEKYGGKTIILARFVPVVRTFAPFVAGVGKMDYFRFAMYNVVGAILWVGLCVGAGVAFGSREFVKKNFELVILVIVFISILPMVIEFIRAKRAAKTGGSAVVEATTIGQSE